MRTHCKAGHEFTTENTYIYKSKRICRECRRVTMNERRTPLKRGQFNSRKTECPQGHEYTDSNTLRYKAKRICKACAKANADWQRLKKYGLDKPEYLLILAKQLNRCAICSREFLRTPHIDHDHITGIVRGLLCYPCNSGLGQFEDSVDRLEKAIEYLKH